jgi:hypothetical protein
MGKLCVISDSADLIFLDLQTVIPGRAPWRGPGIHFSINSAA